MIREAALALPVPLEWHPGYELSVRELRRHADYRGPAFVALGVRIAEGDRLDPRIIGDAARGGRHELQDLKMVWHCLARFGAPEGAGTARCLSSREAGAGAAELTG